MKRKSLFFIILAIYAITASSQTLRRASSYKLETKQCAVPRLLLITDDLVDIVDSVVLEFNKCKKQNAGYPWIVSIQLDCAEDRKDLYCISFSQSMFSDATAEGYGFFYYGGLLFIVKGVQCEQLFKKTNEKKRFEFYKDAPSFIFDPPRWLYVYDGEKLIEIEKSPCGG